MYMDGRELFSLMDALEVDPTRVVLEVSETIDAAHVKAISKFLVPFRNRGVQVALDDVGVRGEDPDAFAPQRHGAPPPRRETPLDDARCYRGPSPREPCTRVGRSLQLWTGRGAACAGWRSPWG